MSEEGEHSMRPRSFSVISVLTEPVVTMKGKAVVQHQTGNEPRLVRIRRRGR